MKPRIEKPVVNYGDYVHLLEDQHELKRYTEWLEEMLIGMQPHEQVCRSPFMNVSQWCYDNCDEDSPSPRCLHRLYELQKGVTT